MHRPIALFLSVLVCLSCGDDEKKANVGDPCGKDGCADGLFCAAGGDMQGRCTAQCTGNSECQARFGNNTRCYNQLCTKTCTGTWDCYGGNCTYLSSGSYICLAQ